MDTKHQIRSNPQKPPKLGAPRTQKAKQIAAQNAHHPRLASAPVPEVTRDQNNTPAPQIPTLRESNIKHPASCLFYPIPLLLRAFAPLWRESALDKCRAPSTNRTFSRKTNPIPPNPKSPQPLIPQRVTPIFRSTPPKKTNPNKLADLSHGDAPVAGQSRPSQEPTISKRSADPPVIGRNQYPRSLGEPRSQFIGTQSPHPPFRSFDHLNLDGEPVEPFRICLGFRDSDFGFAPTLNPAAHPAAGASPSDHPSRYRISRCRSLLPISGYSPPAPAALAQPR